MLKVNFKDVKKEMEEMLQFSVTLIPEDRGVRLERIHTSNGVRFTHQNGLRFGYTEAFRYIQEKYDAGWKVLIMRPYLLQKMLFVNNNKKEDV